MEQHLTWPDAFAVVGVAWAVVLYFYVLIKK